MLDQLLPVISSKLAVAFAMLVVILILIVYRKTVSHELEPVPVAVILFGLVETLVAAVSKEPTPQTSIVLAAFLFSSVAIIVIFITQRRLTDDRIEEVLYSDEFRLPGSVIQDQELHKLVKVGQGVIDVDIFPKNRMEATFGERAKRRRYFYDILPSTVFDKDKLSPDEFLIPCERTVGLCRWYKGLSWGSLGLVLALIFFVL